MPLPSPTIQTAFNGRSVTVRWPGTGLSLLVEEGVSAWTWHGRVVRWVKRAANSSEVTDPSALRFRPSLPVPGDS